ncbi:MAG: PmoA family protein [Planctomycetes bacterium]|nr:PmoA family protein [Planctomycetota bacterium]
MKSALAIAFVMLLAPILRAEEPAVGIKKTKNTIEFSVGKDKVTTYHFGESVAKPYFYPLYAPGNVPVTRAWPMEKGAPKETVDHIHQKSVWFCHGDIIPEGIELKAKIKGVKGVDFWSENVGHGKIVCTEVGEPKMTNKGASISTRNEWRTAEGVRILDEVRTIHFQVIGDSRLLTLDIELTASVCPLTFGDTKEGSMGVRVNDEIITKNGGHFYNANGKVDEKEIWGHPSDWCDYVGSVGGKLVGISVFDDPSNKPRANWHARGYGLMAANPFGRDHSFPSQKGNTDLFKMAKGEKVKLRYGILAHAGDTKAAKVAEAYEVFKKRVD